MRTVAGALGSLPDNGARARVLEWAVAHFASSTNGSRPTAGSEEMPTASGPIRVADFSALSLGEDIFEPTANSQNQPPRFVPVEHGFQPRAESWRRPAGSRSKLESQLRDMARAFRKFTSRDRRAS